MTSDTNVQTDFNDHGALLRRLRARRCFLTDATGRNAGPERRPDGPQVRDFETSPPDGASLWPPNWNRMADSSRSENG